MFLYIVDYDLNAPGKNYEALIEQIKTYSWAKICMSSWAIRSSSTASQIRDHLMRYIDDNDPLFVARIDDWAASGISRSLGDWLNS